jgi:signal transduction histidine kinase
VDFLVISFDEFILTLLLQRIIDDVLDASKFQKGMVRFEKEKFEVNQVARAAVDFARPKAKAKGLDLEYSTTQDPLLIESDHVRIVQVISNLLSNAIKFTDKGFVRVSVSTDFEENDRGIPTEYLNIQVQDTGIGIPENFAEKMFGAFEQTAEGAARGGSGFFFFFFLATVDEPQMR